MIESRSSAHRILERKGPGGEILTGPFCCACKKWVEALDVWSRHVVERVESESFGHFCPELANTLKGSQASETLKALREVVGIEERGDMRAKAAVRLVVEPPDRRVLDGSIHSFDLAIRPGVVELGEAMVDAELGAGQIKGVGTEGLPVREQKLDLPNPPTALRWRELKPVVREHGVNAVGHAFNEPSQEVRRDPTRGLFVELREGEFADPVDRDEQIQLAFFGPHLRQVDVDVPERIRPELPSWRWALDARQTADPMALEKTVQGGSREMRDRRRKGVEAIIEWQ